LRPEGEPLVRRVGEEGLENQGDCASQENSRPEHLDQQGHHPKAEDESRRVDRSELPQPGPPVASGAEYQPTLQPVSLNDSDEVRDGLDDRVVDVPTKCELEHDEQSVTEEGVQDSDQPVPYDLDTEHLTHPQRDWRRRPVVNGHSRHLSRPSAGGGRRNARAAVPGTTREISTVQYGKGTLRDQSPPGGRPR